MLLLPNRLTGMGDTLPYVLTPPGVTAVLTETAVRGIWVARLEPPQSAEVVREVIRAHLRAGPPVFLLVEADGSVS